MALIYRVLYRNCYLHSISRPIKWNVTKNYPLRMLGSGVCFQNNVTYRPILEVNHARLSGSLRQCSTSASNSPADKPSQEPEGKKPGLVQRFKQMYKDYWYVLLPVHMVTSAIWYGSFYYAVSSGVDAVGILESLGVSETLVAPLRDSAAGYFALAFALYKLVTPLRYAVTVGGTTFAINRLTAVGWIKPVPSRERIKEMFQEKKDNLQDRFHESKQYYQSQMKEKRTQVMDEMRRYKSDMRDMKSKVKKM